jgi:hypothetical protein
MRPHQLRSLFVALQQEKRSNRELASKVASLETERATMQETLSCVQRHWDQVRYVFRRLQRASRAPRPGSARETSVLCNVIAIGDAFDGLFDVSPQLTKDLEHALCGIDVDFCKIYADSSLGSAVVPPSAAKATSSPSAGPSSFSNFRLVYCMFPSRFHQVPLVPSRFDDVCGVPRRVVAQVSTLLRIEVDQASRWPLRPGDPRPLPVMRMLMKMS